jgi:hypothetical protein
MEKIKKHKWTIHWVAFSILITLFVFVAFLFEDKPWLGNVLQSLGTVSGIYLTIIIFFHTKEESDKQNKQYLEYLQLLNSKQIDALQKATEQQIEALQKSTSDQISAFEKQISEVTEKLSENSIILAEILGRELEKSIEVYSKSLKKEEAKFKELADWKLLRTPAEKEQQLEMQKKRILTFRNLYNYLVDKYNSVRQYLGYTDQFQLDE